MRRISVTQSIWTAGLVLGALFGGALALAQTSELESDAPLRPGEVRVAMLRYADERSGRCFSSGFLQTAAYDSHINVDTTLHEVDLDSEELFSYPFIVMTGEGGFHLGDAEVATLREYLTRGGFLLASAGCSNRAWASSMERVMERMFPDLERSNLDFDHEVFHTLIDIDSLYTTQGKSAWLQGLSLDGRLALVYSPEGLNDTDSAGGGCCCCGGRELREARLMNANLLAYALLR